MPLDTFASALEGEQVRAPRTQGGFMWSRQFLGLEINLWAPKLAQKEHFPELRRAAPRLPDGHIGDSQ